MLATHRLQDGFALANFRFDAQAKSVKRVRQGQGEAAVTRFLVYKHVNGGEDGHDNGIYFEGSPDEVMNSKDPYVRRFLV